MAVVAKQCTVIGQKKENWGDNRLFDYKHL